MPDTPHGAGEAPIDGQIWAFADFAVGQRFETEVDLTETAVADYLRVTGYSCPLFTEPEAARAAGFERTPVPSMYATTYAFVSKVPGIQLAPGGVHAKQEFRFLNPTYVGDRLHTVITVSDKYERRGKKYLVFDSITTNQHGEPAVWGRRTRIWPD